MKYMCRPLSIVLGTLILTSASAATCIGVQKKLKPISHACGFVVDPTGVPIVGARIFVFKDGTEVAEAQTDADGKFSFGDIKEGDYQLMIQAPGFASFSFPIVVHKPAQKCKQSLRVQLSIGYPACGSSVILRYH
jgi:hypothetical protein